MGKQELTKLIGEAVARWQGAAGGLARLEQGGKVARRGRGLGEA